jgi:hypothetical protein
MFGQPTIVTHNSKADVRPANINSNKRHVFLPGWPFCNDVLVGS